jgi:PAS domain-containing protein
MAGTKPIQVILARQLASSLATPILIVDTDGTLIYYNEPAEAILNQRFEETGEIGADTWSTLFALTDENRCPIAQEDRPTMRALSERKPVSRTVWMQCGHRDWKNMNITAFPLIGEGKQFLGAQMIFWEV